MSQENIKKHTTHIIWIICIVIVLGIFAVPQIYRNYHSAPYCNNSGSQITLEDSQTHKLNSYQKAQFIKLAKTAIDQKDGPFDWQNYQTVSLKVYKMKQRSEYGLIYKVKPTIRSKQHTITNSIIVKLSNRNLKSYKKFSIKGYSSDFSNFLN